MSDQPMGFLPQPMASAIGFHIAITTGDSTRFSVDVISSCPVLVCDWALPSLMNAADAGLMRCGWRDPLSTSSMHSPDPMGMARTKMRLPPGARWSSRLKRSVTSLIQRSFSEPYVNSGSMESGGACATLPLSSLADSPFFDLHAQSPRRKQSRRKTVSGMMLNRGDFSVETTRLELLQRAIRMMPPESTYDC